MNKYRIREIVRKNGQRLFYPERRCWFWWTPIEDSYGDPEWFYSKLTAQEFLAEFLNEKQRIADKEIIKTIYHPF